MGSGAVRQSGRVHEIAWRASAFAFVATFAVDRAHAAEPADGKTLPIELTYSAPATCPTRDDVLRAVTTRNPHVSQGTAPPGRRFDLEVVEREGRIVGSVEEPARASRREVEGTDCSRVVEALTLIVALAVEPDNTRAGEAQPPEAERRASDPQETKPRQTVTPTKPELGAGADPTVDASIPFSRTRPLGWSLGAGGVLLVGPAPTPLVGASAFAEWAHDDGWVFLRATFRASYALGSPDDRAREVLPSLGVRWEGRRFSGCFQAGVAVGSLELVGSSDRGMLWVSAVGGPCLRVRWDGIFAEIGGEVGLPLGSRRADFRSPPFETRRVTGGLLLLFGFGGVRGG